MKRRLPVILFILALILVSAIVSFKTVRDKVGERLISNIIETNPEVKQIIDNYSAQYQVPPAEEINAPEDISSKPPITDIIESFRKPKNTPSLLDDLKNIKGGTNNLGETPKNAEIGQDPVQNSSALAKSFWDEPLVKSVYARFSASEIAMASSALAGGLSAEKKQEIKNIVLSRVSAHEIHELQRLYNLHGGK